MKTYRLLPLLAATVTAALTAACTVGPDYHEPSVATPADWAQSAKLDRQDRTDAASDRLAQWWTSFQDPMLDGLVGEAIAGNHDLRIAAQRISEARADRAIAAAGGQPSLSFSTDPAKHRPAP